MYGDKAKTPKYRLDYLDVNGSYGGHKGIWAPSILNVTIKQLMNDYKALEKAMCKRAKEFNLPFRIVDLQKDVQIALFEPANCYGNKIDKEIVMFEVGKEVLVLPAQFAGIIDEVYEIKNEEGQTKPLYRISNTPALYQGCLFEEHELVLKEDLPWNYIMTWVGDEKILLPD